MQKSEETAAEAKSERDGCFRLKSKRGVVELELFKRVLCFVVLCSVCGINSGVHHRLNLLKSGERLICGSFRVCYGIADSRIADVFD